MAAPLSVEVEFGEVFAGTDWLSFSGPPLQRWRGAPVRRCEKASGHLAWPGGALGHPEPPGLDQEEFAKRAAGAVHPGRQCGELDYQLQDQDSVLFISTLHGG
ncbi:ubiquitin-related modifier 1 isoform X4 [Pipistrellus kuhlii]|uniref:ubiquitin-related modifier 1 isoform X4 n=1 Tax=Pipistrellus kuhlii TaxID=59472 RepID=UPI001E26F677|nr:ubiquitin-related modifier 1 isoform X4 [Pipistrellus kuhlii]